MHEGTSALGSPRSGPRAAEGDRWLIAVTSMNFGSFVLSESSQIQKVTSCMFLFCKKFCSGRKLVCGCRGGGWGAGAGAEDDCRALENIRGPRKCSGCRGCGRGYHPIICRSSLNQYILSCENCISSQFFKKEKKPVGLNPSSAPLRPHCHSRARPRCGPFTASLSRLSHPSLDQVDELLTHVPFMGYRLERPAEPQWGPGFDPRTGPQSIFLAWTQRTFPRLGG